ncbi:MAG: fructose-bisphosphate aldolase [Candidatus Synoicihabitans palmerolidicus]|nr:fructose-bisphosphate aldolase [Candidatus Synoicihabitans palmerolidicus]
MASHVRRRRWQTFLDRARNQRPYTALFAATSQEAGLVPIVEPEILITGSHTPWFAANKSPTASSKRSLPGSTSIASHSMGCGSRLA